MFCVLFSNKIVNKPAETGTKLIWWNLLNQKIVFFWFNNTHFKCMISITNRVLMEAPIVVAGEYSI